MSSIIPLPVEPEIRRRNVKWPPNMVYTSLESMKYIKEWDKDSEVNFDEEEPVTKRGRGRGRGDRGTV